MTTLLLAGTTGVVGERVLELALRDTRVTRVVALARRPLAAQPKLESHVVDFDALPEDAAWWRVDGVICALGTTLRAAGSPENFRRVDFTYPLAIARLAQRHGAQSFALASSLGADARSRAFYLRTKGELEQALADLGYASFTAVRPSMINARRKDARPAEATTLFFMRLLEGAIPRAWRAVKPECIAKALLDAAIEARPGVRVIMSAELHSWPRDRAA